MDEARIREAARQSYDRCFDPIGVARQRLASYASGDRTAALVHVRLPALVVHGDANPLIQLVGGRATAAALPNAELLVMSGMGHNLPNLVHAHCSNQPTRRPCRSRAPSTVTD